MLKSSSHYYLILPLFILSSCEADERILARLFVPIIVIGLLGLISIPFNKKSKDKRTNQLNEEIKNIESQNPSVNISPQSKNSTLPSEFIFTAASKRGVFMTGCVFLFLGLALSVYTIFLLNTFLIFVFFLIGFITWLLYRSHIEKELKATIKLFDKEIELKIQESNETITFYPSEISYLRLYEVHSISKGMMKHLQGKMIELKFNEWYLQTNQSKKLEKFKTLFCDLRPSKIQATRLSYGLLNLTKEEIRLLWNEYGFLSGDDPLLDSDGRQFRNEILTFCIKNSVEILNEIDHDYIIND